MGTKRVLSEDVSAERIAVSGESLEHIAVHAWSADTTDDVNEVYLTFSGVKTDKTYVMTREAWDALKLI